MADDEHYAKLGFKCGLEIHQRLATERKLFCACPASTTERPSSAAIFRYQRAVAGELGAVDVSAQFEELKKRRFVYNIYKEHTCLVDIDEEPPREMNNEALGIALSVASALDMSVADELEPMRKEVVDGSNPSAFQRTVLVGMDGKVKTGASEVGITMMSLEEESAGISGKGADSITYDSDRIGIPLVEIDTSPFIRSPAEAKKVALYLGTLLRLTGRVQRGIGSIRQDVNVSIRGGSRVEIKGLQELDTMDRFIENEVLRQQKLLEIKDWLIKRSASVGSSHDLTKLLKGTKVKIIADMLRNGGMAVGIALPGFKGALGTEVNPGRRLGTEISDYAKMGGVKGIIHSDEDLKAYGFEDKEIEAVRGHMKLKEDGAFIIIAGTKESAPLSMMLAAERVRAALVGVPEETRAVASAETFTTRFMRPLPGGSRMYPETDVRPIQVTDRMLSDAKKLAPSIEKERSRLMKELNSAELAALLMVSPRLPLYKVLAAQEGADFTFIANTLLQKFTELRRGGFAVDSIPESRLAELFGAYAKGKLTKHAVDEVLKALSGKEGDVDTIIKGKGLARMTGSELKNLVQRFRKEEPKLSNAELIRRIMQKHRLNVDGAELNKVVSGE